MPSSCAVCSCLPIPSRLTLYNLPKDKERHQTWIDFIKTARRQKKGLDEDDASIQPPQSARVCSAHFDKEDFTNFSQFKMGLSKKLLLKQGACPSIYQHDHGDTNSSSENESNDYIITVSHLTKGFSKCSYNLKCFLFFT